MSGARRRYHNHLPADRAHPRGEALQTHLLDAEVDRGQERLRRRGGGGGGGSGEGSSR